MIRALYSIFMRLAQPFMRARLMRRGALEPGYLLAIDERFGRYSTDADGAMPEPGCLWIHAVSLGETRAAAILITALRSRMPGMRLLLTHGTATGREEGGKLLQPGDLQAWQPWDTPEAVARFLTHFKPRIGILIETEVWPNLVATAKQMNVPLVLANARMSSKSLSTSLKLGWLSRPAYSALAGAWAQTQADASRLYQLGAPVQGVFGNIKFDATPDADLLARGRLWRKSLRLPVVMLAVSREGEEAQLVELLRSYYVAASASQVKVTDVQWMIVPRHPQRFDDVARLIEAGGFNVSRRSDWAYGPQNSVPQEGVDVSPTLWLGDSMGEMPLYYGLADAALLGGSFEKLGGQNLIEAAACGCPVIMGPHTFNFAEAASLANAAGAAQRVPTLARAVVAACETVLDAPSLQASRHNALAFAQAHRGSASLLAAAIEDLLNKTPAP
jgi:3-deoxy-D-manno-octulosonic-acid transferase